MVATIGNPLSWAAEAIGRSFRHMEAGTGELVGEDTGKIETRTLHVSDLRIALQKGLDDFLALRTDVMLIVVIYPVVGVVLSLFALNTQMLPLLFPLISGFALLGPVAAVGLYEMSRRRELGQKTGWADAFSVMASPSFVPIFGLGIGLVAIFLVWMFAAFVIYNLTVGPELPGSIMAFVQDVFLTPAGWAMIILGVAVGFIFAALVLAISVVSFPLLVDRHVGLARAVVTSVTIARQSPVTVAIWGAIVAALLGLGVVTLFLGLIIVLPVLGHATWHLYRRAVVSTTAQDPPAN